MLETIKGTMIVSCQALEDEPLYGAKIMAKMAKACVLGGASAIRANGVKDIIEIKKRVDVPIIGLIKINYPDSDIYITPTIKEVNELLITNCEMIAVDATQRPRPNQQNLHELLKLIHDNNRYAMADISTLQEAINAKAMGFDVVSTTLSGYTPYSPQSNEPDYQLIQDCVAEGIDVISEGRIWDTNQLRKILELKPFAVVIGSAITRPMLITKHFKNCYKV